MQYRIIVASFFSMLVCIAEEGSCSDISSCNATHMEAVERCPRSRQEWEEEARLKNCENLVLPYHCLINTWLNKTVSVCATPQFINGYRCAEFNIRGNSIQPHYETDCRSFTPPCPFLYKSNMAFQYQGCYELVKRDNTTLTSILSFVNVTTTIPNDVDKSGNDRSNASVLWPMVGLLMVLAIGSVMHFMYKKWCKGRYFTKRETIDPGKEETTHIISHNLDTLITE